MGQRLGDESDIEVRVVGEPLQGVYLSHVGEDGAFGDVIDLDREEAILLAMVLVSAIPEMLDAELSRFVRFLHDEGYGLPHQRSLIQKFIETSHIDWSKLAQDAERGKE